ncbi:MAG: hypothetical protein B7Y91_01410 [Rhodobacterales bacterium 32-64-14]|nr:MAG: hypothetical protein B7Y91_01410 [Rhodobacterales bacterium 32-64-14]
MTRSPSVEDLVLGHVLDDRRRGRGGGDGSSSRLGTRKERQTRALLRNAGGPRGWQSVVKRIAGGSARTPQELKRLLDYVAREEGVQSTWCNMAGYERDFDPARTARTADIWSSTWTGAPRRGHADHIVLSFPRGVDAERAEVIAREWGQAVFGSGEYGDVWRYVAALHKGMGMSGATSLPFTRTPTTCTRISWSTSMASRKAGSCRSVVMLH